MVLVTNILSIDLSYKRNILLNKNLGVSLRREVKQPHVTKHKTEWYIRKHNTGSSPISYKKQTIIT